MFSRIVAGSLAAALVFSSVTANAHGIEGKMFHFKHFKHFHLKHIHFPKPAPAPAPSSQAYGPTGGHRSPPVFSIYMASAIGCGTIGLMAGSVGRQMKIEEAEYIVGSCFIPFVGGELFRYLRTAMNPPKPKFHRRRHG